MKKKILGIIMLLAIVGIAYTNNVNAASSRMEDYLTCENNHKYYDGKTIEKNACTSSELELGKDYIVKYYFTQSRRENIGDFEDKLKDTREGMVEPGFIWEEYIGIGDYERLAPFGYRAEILTYIWVYALDNSKVEGEEDPELSYSVKIYNDADNDITNFFDIELTREAGEEPGEYKINAKLTQKESIPTTELITLQSGNYIQAIGDNTKGRVWILPVEGTFTIKEKGTVIIKYVDLATNKEIDSKTISGAVGAEYKTEPKEIEGYVYADKVEGNAEGTYTKEDQIVTYYYNAENGQVAGESATFEEEQPKPTDSGKVLGESETNKDELPPKTGDTIAFMAIAFLLSLFGMLFMTQRIVARRK